jgi:hypothetical protein
MRYLVLWIVVFLANFLIRAFGRGVPTGSALFKVDLSYSLLMASVMCLSIWTGFRAFSILWRALYS